jgi:hypothetical protein
VSDFGKARWYVVRPARSNRPRTYRCPLCGGHLPAMTPHSLLLPEDRPEGRRHAHTQCALAARRDGRLPLREDVEPPRPGPLARLRKRFRRGDSG